MIDESFKQLLDLRELGGELAKLRVGVLSGRNTCVFSATLSQRAHIAWGLGRPILFVTQDRNRANQAYSMFKEYVGDKVGLLVEREESLVFKPRYINTNTSSRIKTLNELANNAYLVLVVTPEVLLQYLPEPKSLKARVITLEKGKDYDIGKVITALINAGYNRRETIEGRGEFTLRGDILSVFPNNSTEPLRVTFFGDTVEQIKAYDLESMEGQDLYDRAELIPIAEFQFNDIVIENAIKSANIESLKLPSDTQRLRAGEIMQELELANVSGNKESVISFLLPFIGDKSTISEYMPSNTVVVYDEPKILTDKLTLYYKDHLNRQANLLESGEVLPRHKHTLVDLSQALRLFDKFTGLGFANMASNNPIFKPMEIFNINSTPTTNYYMNFQALFSDLKSYNSCGYKVIISCGDEYTANHIRGTLFDENIFASVCGSIDTKLSGVIVTTQTISHGFLYKRAKLVVIGRDELIRKRENIAKQNKKNQVFTVPKCGDFVVHEVHGIGMCAGVERIKTQGVEKDFVVINYLGNDKLFVPVDQMDRLSRYSGSDVEPKLSKIGGKDFQKVREKVKLSVKAMAFDLLELYRNRQNSKGFKYSEDTVWQTEFEESFEYEETADQLRSVAEIKTDMERGIVMDRLLCGDVGYGKTEVALRAVFKTVMDGKQAAILAPTAILARQHYNTAMARFNQSKLNCVLLSRFQTSEDMEKSIAKIESGEASVIIGTHRLLSDKIKFHDLGLLVLDEEQRFGVEHKEKLKVFNSDINVLTLSATPIPRTLNMALTGVRDISVLETPPVDRLPIETCVTELTDSLLEEAINRELSRDGQVFVLYNRVEDIESIAAKIKKLVPKGKVIIGHGQMSDIALENAINAFYNKEYNILVATTIIENGIDLPDANTLIVCDADRLGLSALYQLRGRVGRSNKLAYAYFTTRQGKVLTEDAMKRLTAIMDYTDFGSGFKIAMRDLEIRGAGNVLGKEQHGHIVKVGYDMYCKLLREAVEEISGNNIESNNCEMNIDINSYLDGNYIANNNEKIKIYKEIAEISSESEKKSLIDKLADSYGAPSEALTNLIEIALVKNLAAAVGAKKVTVNIRGAGILFDANVYKNKKLIFAISDRKEDCVLSADANPTLAFNVKNCNIMQKLDFVKKFLLGIDNI